MIPVKHGISFTWFEYLVHVMINECDGSVTVIHGGIEMGQGINTKVSTDCYGVMMCDHLSARFALSHI